MSKIFTKADTDRMRQADGFDPPPGTITVLCNTIDALRAVAEAVCELVQYQPSVWPPLTAALLAAGYLLDFDPPEDAEPKARAGGGAMRSTSVSVALLKPGDRIRHKYLGDGTFLDRAAGLVGAKWDETPEWEYNCGRNPCYVLPEDITLLPLEEKEVTL